MYDGARCWVNKQLYRQNECSENQDVEIEMLYEKKLDLEMSILAKQML